MKTEYAEHLNFFMNNAIENFIQFRQKTKNDIPLKDVEKQRFHVNVFRNLFTNFTNELIDNIRNYKDIEIVKDFVIVSFPNLLDIIPFHKDENKYIIESGYEVEFLLGLKKNIEYYMDEIQALSTTDETYSFATSLRYLFERESKNKFCEVPEQSIDIETILNTHTIIKRFTLEHLKEECAMCDSNIKKIKLIHDRLFDFEQWQIQSDKYIHNRDFGSYYEYTQQYYPDFEKLCAVELRRLEKQMEIEQRLPITSTTSPQPTPAEPYLKWTASETDLLEMVTAIHLNKSIERKDGKPLTRKELIETFEEMFHFKIKDPEGKLNKATNRKTNTTPFMDRLKTAFENYVEEKDEKQRKRR